MSAILLGLIIVVGVFFCLVLYCIGIYNKLIGLRNIYKNAYSQIDVQLKRRYDLIPNLVETAKGYLSHERQTLEAVIAARNSALNASQKAAQNPGETTSMQGLMGAETALTSSLGRLFALSEAYPDLKANQNMMQLSEELTSTENKISFARQAYNDAVMRYNTITQVVPNNIVAGIFQFTPATLFEVENAAQKEAPKVSFS
ncbi:MAG: LemA family protein [Verrucomicrobiia bacterium]